MFYKYRDRKSIDDKLMKDMSPNELAYWVQNAENPQVLRVYMRELKRRIDLSEQSEQGHLFIDEKDNLNCPPDAWKLIKKRRRRPA